MATEIVQHQSPLCWQEQKAGYFLREKGLEKEKQNENKMQNIILVNGFLHGSGGKESACNVGDMGSIPRSGRSPGEGHGNPLQYSCLENPMGRGPGRLQSTGLQRVRHDWSNWACVHMHLDKLPVMQRDRSLLRNVSGGRWTASSMCIWPGTPL